MSEYVNVSAFTSQSVIGHRRLRRRGIVIHTTEGINSLGWLQGGSAVAGPPASSDFLVYRNGDIYQITPPGWFAYHSGRARWNLYQEADTTINQGFYGIELEQSQELGQKVTDAQYISLAWLCRVLMTVNHMMFSDLTDHRSVALPAGRKSDPSGFDFTIFTHELLYPSPDWNGYMLLEELP
jgi:N-acetyl-anhydromuramyl-L-alanine amidase AmpD